MADEGSDSGFSVITAFTAPYVYSTHHAGHRTIPQASAHMNSICRITAILISRFLLELQATNHMVVKLDADDPLHLSRNAWDGSTPSFISSLGGFINPELAARSDDDDDGVDLQDRPPSEAPEAENGGAHTEVPEATASSISTS